MRIERSFTLNVSYSQVSVFDRSLDQPFNFWTASHTAQGFTWRPGSVGFRTLAEGPHDVQVIATSSHVGVPQRAVRVIQVPFDVPPNGSVEIASIADSIALELPPQSYALRFECLAGNSKPELNLVFTKEDNAGFEIIRSDSELTVIGKLLLTATPA